jgi:hypothetical protein
MASRGIRLAALIVLLGLPVPSHAGPEPGKAWAALVETPLKTTGDVIGAAGLISASVVALAGDAVALIDATYVPPGPLGGWVSGPIKRLGMTLSWTGTGALEALRGEDIERLPEDPATYRTAAPGRGRLDTFLTGVGAIRLAVRDLVTGPALVVLRLVGTNALAERVERGNADARTRLLGPLPLPKNGP